MRQWILQQLVGTLHMHMLHWLGGHDLRFKFDYFHMDFHKF